MSIYLRKVFGALALLLLVMLEGALMLATGIGLTTAPEDAENLPRLLVWLIGTPWWVPGLVIPGALIAFALWVFWPDNSMAKEWKKVRLELKESNKKAWEFQPTLDSVLDKLESLSTELKTAKEEYEKTAGSAESKADAVASRMNQFEYKVEEGVKTIAELDIKIQNRIYEELPKEIKDIAGDSETWSGLWGEHTGELHEVRERLSKVESHLPQSPPGTEEETPQ